MSGLLPGPNPGDGRYAPGTRGAIKPWSAAEDAAIWPPLLVCESEGAYIGTCRVLCRLLEREPQFASGRPTAAEHAAKAVSLIEVRAVTYQLGGRRGIAEQLTTFYHDGHMTPRRGATPLTWAERQRFLATWAKKPGYDEPRIALHALTQLLWRTQDDARPHNPVGEYLRFLESGKKRPDYGSTQARIPAEEKGFEERFRAAVADSAALPALMAFCLGE